MKKITLAIVLLCLFFMSACTVPLERLSEESPLETEERVSEFPQAVLTEDQPSETSETLTEEPKETPAVEPEQPQTAKKAAYIRSKTNSLNVRTGAGVGYPILGTLDKGDMTKYISAENGWYKTTFRNKTAYVCADYAELYFMETASEKTEKVIEEGLKLLGAPYVYGAVRYHDGRGNRLKNFTDEEFDCSSLMQYIFFKGAGINLDVNTRTQIKQGEKIEEFKRGDLLFFTNASRKNKTGTERVGHVALYLGDNYILHTASDHAVIEEITPLRKSYFIQANRII